MDLTPFAFQDPGFRLYWGTGQFSELDAILDPAEEVASGLDATDNTAYTHRALQRADVRAILYDPKKYNTWSGNHPWKLTVWCMLNLFRVYVWWHYIRGKETLGGK